MWTLLLVSASLAAVPAPCGESPYPGRPTVHLITVGPAERIDRVFGHTGLYVQDASAGIDVVYNFGFYDGLGSAAIRDFLLGDQRYWLQTRSWDDELEKYRAEGRRMHAQRLDLSPEQAAKLVAALAFLDQDSQRHYDYHWYASNCTTKVRDLLDVMLGGALSSQLDVPSGTTQRFEVLRHIHPIPWAWYGLSYGAAARTDRELTRYEAAFLPDNLAEALEDLSVDGRPSVVSTCQVLEARVPEPLPAPPRRGPLLGGAGLVLGLATAFGSRRTAAMVLALHAGVATVAGTVSTLLWAISRTEAYWANSHLLLASPAHVGLVLGAVWLARKDPRARWPLLAALGIGLVGVVVGVTSGKPTLGWAGFFLLPWVGALVAVRR